MTINLERPKSNQRTFDTLLVLKDAGLVASSAAAQVASAARIVDLGLGRVEADVLIDATAVEVDSSNELFTITCEFSNSSTFASVIATGAMQYLGHATAIPGGGDINQVAGRYQIPFVNVINGTHYRYMRLFTLVAGTVGTGVNYSAYITKN